MVFGTLGRRHGSNESFCNFAIKFPTFEDVLCLFHTFMGRINRKIEFLH